MNKTIFEKFQKLIPMISEVIKLSDEFVEYLLSDGIVLPKR